MLWPGNHLRVEGAQVGFTFECIQDFPGGSAVLQAVPGQVVVVWYHASAYSEAYLELLRAKDGHSFLFGLFFKKTFPHLDKGLTFAHAFGKGVFFCFKSALFERVFFI